MNRRHNPAFAEELFTDRFHDSFFLNEYGRLEAMRAARYNTRFSVVLVMIEPADDAVRSKGGRGGRGGRGKARQKVAGELTATELTEVLAVAVAESLRICDVVGLTDQRHIAAILPETDWFGSLATIKKLRRATAELTAPGRSIDVTFSHATYSRDGHGFTDLISAAEESARHKRNSMWTTHALDGRLFWEIIAALFESDAAGAECSAFDAGGDHPLPPSFLDHLGEQVVREITRDPHKKGILYLSPRPDGPRERMAGLLESAARAKARVFVVGSGRDRLEWVKDAPTVPLDDPRLDDTFFAFYLSSDSAYAFIGREGWGGTFTCFHTSDEYLVEGLITKLQGEYQLQEQLG